MWVFPGSRSLSPFLLSPFKNLCCLGVPWWLSELRTWHCHHWGSGYCCGTESIPGQRTSAWRGCSQKKICGVSTIKDPELPKQSWRKKKNKKQNKRPNSARLPTILQSYSNQDSVVLTQKQTFRSMEQNREPRKNPDTHGQLIFDEGGKNTKWEKDSIFSNWCWENLTAACKSMKLELSIHKNKLKTA